MGGAYGNPDIELRENVACYCNLMPVLTPEHGERTLGGAYGNPDIELRENVVQNPTTLPPH